LTVIAVIASGVAWFACSSGGSKSPGARQTTATPTPTATATVDPSDIDDPRNYPVFQTGVNSMTGDTDTGIKCTPVSATLIGNSAGAQVTYECIAFKGSDTATAVTTYTVVAIDSVTGTDIETVTNDVVAGSGKLARFSIESTYAKGITRLRIEVNPAPAGATTNPLSLIKVTQ
jgi:hypothetical protein